MDHFCFVGNEEVELRHKIHISVKWPIYIHIFTCDHEPKVMTKRTRLQVSLQEHYSNKVIKLLLLLVFIVLKVTKMLFKMLFNAFLC